MNLFKWLLALPLIRKDWWKLHCKRMLLPTNSKYDVAIKIQLRLRHSGSYIGKDTHFESKPVFPHGINGIFISGGAKIGKNCVIFQQVTIGSNTLIGSKSYGSPTIGKNCYIGAGAKIIGKVHIGDNCRIGANAVVTKDVPDNTVVVMSTMRYIHHDEQLDNRYVTLRSDGSPIYYSDGAWRTLEND